MPDQGPAIQEHCRSGVGRTCGWLQFGGKFADFAAHEFQTLSNVSGLSHDIRADVDYVIALALVTGSFIRSGMAR